MQTHRFPDRPGWYYYQSRPGTTCPIIPAFVATAYGRVAGEPDYLVLRGVTEDTRIETTSPLCWHGPVPECGQAAEMRIESFWAALPKPTATIMKRRHFRDNVVKLKQYARGGLEMWKSIHGVGEKRAREILEIAHEYGIHEIP